MFLEPFRTKVVEPIKFLDVPSRTRILREAGYNLFRVPADDVTVDLLTDSGTTAMSAAQWAAMMLGDESYAEARSYRRFAEVVTDLTGMSYVIPVHQGRAAERILFWAMDLDGRTTIANMHFDSTRANLDLVGCKPIDLPCPEAADLGGEHPFKGNLDIDQVRAHLAGSEGPGVAAVIVTVTNNGGGGQPVSMSHLRELREICSRHAVPLLLDASRFAENAYLVTQREPGYSGRSVRSVAQEMFGLADGCWASLKKDGMANIGGMIALNDPDLAARCTELLVVTEGFPTYGGLAGRDLEALAQGLVEVTDPDYLAYRHATAAWFADALDDAGLPVTRPVGCHAVYVDAGKVLHHLTPQDYPGHAIACELYLRAGVRVVDFGTLTFGRPDPAGGPDEPAPHELVRMALPRRVYSMGHLAYVADSARRIVADADKVPGYRIVGRQAMLRHFTATLEPVLRA